MGCWVVGMGVWAQTVDMPPQRCAGDALSQALRLRYPNGVPGRTLPADDKVGQVDSTPTYIIPVVVHVMHAYGPERNVTPAQIQSQIEILNEGFGRYGEGANTHPLGGDVRIRFCLASIDPDGNPTPGYDYTVTEYASSLDPYTEDTLMKRLNQWDPDRYVNIWTVRAISDGVVSYAGYTFIPEEVAGTIYDGIVITYQEFGRGTGTATKRGKTGTHEAGHYFDLYHPWGIAENEFCPSNTDYCEDTPPVPNSLVQTPFPDCLDTNLIQYACDTTRRQLQNYMDYSDDQCQNLFTYCQITRMRRALLRFRSEMVSTENLIRTGCIQKLAEIPAQGEIFIYPNPANTYLMINMDLEKVGDVRIEMYDFAGRKVLTRTARSHGRGPLSLDLSTVAEGMYYLKVYTSDTVVSTKLFVGRYDDHE